MCIIVTNTPLHALWRFFYLFFYLQLLPQRIQMQRYHHRGGLYFPWSSLSFSPAARSTTSTCYSNEQSRSFSVFFVVLVQELEQEKRVQWDTLMKRDYVHRLSFPSELLFPYTSQWKSKTSLKQLRRWSTKSHKLV